MLISCLFTRTFCVDHLRQFMNKIMHGSLFLVLSCFYSLCSAANRYTMVAERTELRNILISDNIFHKTESTSVLDCFRQCNDNKSCLSISYHGGTHTCFLYSSFNLNKTGKSEEGWCSYSRGNIYVCLFICLIMLNATFNNISVISWRSVLLLEETGVPGENHRPVTSHFQTLSHNVVHLALIEIRTHNINGDRH